MEVSGLTTRSEATQAARPLDRMVVRLRCWWLGCEQHPHDSAPPEYATCIHCGECVPYGDMVGDTRHNRAKAWARYWLWRKWWPAKCSDCGGRWQHDATRDHLPF